MRETCPRLGPPRISRTSVFVSALSRQGCALRHLGGLGSGLQPDRRWPRLPSPRKQSTGLFAPTWVSETSASGAEVRPQRGQCSITMRKRSPVGASALSRSSSTLAATCAESGKSGCQALSISLFRRDSTLPTVHARPRSRPHPDNPTPTARRTVRVTAHPGSPTRLACPAPEGRKPDARSQKLPVDEQDADGGAGNGCSSPPVSTAPRRRLPLPSMSTSHPTISPWQPDRPTRHHHRGPRPLRRRRQASMKTLPPRPLGPLRPAGPSTSWLAICSTAPLDPWVS